jgi:iron complex outermembrane receptor protein
MKMILHFFFSLLFCQTYAQDSISQKLLEEITVTASRRTESTSGIAYHIAVLDTQDINLIPALQIDDLFILTAGISQDRKTGIFSGSRNIVNMLGITGGDQGRVLILEDGIPLNVSDNGDVNWNRLSPENYSRIEIIKGPVSSTYGSSAMAGIINLVSKLPSKPLEAKANINYGSYNSLGTHIDLSGKQENFFWKSAFNYRRSDGYIMPPDSLRDTTDIATRMIEWGILLKAGYRFSSKLLFNASYSYYDDKHGYGIKILDPDGGYTKHGNHTLHLGINYDNSIWFYNMNIFYQTEDYLKLIEKFRDTVYSAIDVNSERTDAGLLLYGGRQFNRVVLSSGIDIRSGLVKGIDDYRTSTDIVSNSGSISLYSSYLRAESDFFKNKLLISAAINYSVVTLKDASFSIYGATSETSYMLGFEENFHDTTWNAVNPSLSARFKPSRFTDILISYSKGFRAPTIDDLSRSGMVNIGFKEANPLLKPEKIDHYQLSVRTHAVNDLLVSAAFYYSKGKDYIYYKATGETLFGGRRLVYRKENISELESMGSEISIEWKPVEWLRAFSSTFINRSIILSNEMLQGKTLSYSPKLTQGIGISSENKYFNISVIAQYKSQQYMNEENTSSIPAYITYDLSLSKTIDKHYQLYFTGKNLLDKTYLFDGRNLSLGRFLIAGIRFIF